MFEREKENFSRMSMAIGVRNDYAQGGGGNTSLKFDDRMMAVKASGYRLDQIFETSGYVVLDYAMVAEFYKNITDWDDPLLEKESSEIIKKSIIELDGMQISRPSVEAGFHALLKKAVIHSHSAYASIICCSREGRKIVDDIFCNEEGNHIFVPYVNPGFPLTVEIKNEVERFKEKEGRIPGIIFMENHGLIVCHDDHEECVLLHTKVNESIKRYFGIGDDYPKISITGSGNRFESDTGFIKQFAADIKLDRDYIDARKLYPDQLVYLNNNKSLFFDDGGIYYETNRKEAITIEETLLAYLYAISMIEKNALTLRTMPEEGAMYITGWESEAYRKKIAEKEN
jgi:ribulose-5-phosphate 4-epimerase/fuculose-1-phosphate aldolase